MKSKRAFLYPGQWYQFLKVIGLPICTASLFGSIFAAFQRQRSSIFSNFPSYRIVCQSGRQFIPLVSFKQMASRQMHWQNHPVHFPAVTQHLAPFMKK